MRVRGRPEDDDENRNESYDESKYARMGESPPKYAKERITRQDVGHRPRSRYLDVTIVHAPLYVGTTAIP
jgi:hypothetical protein